MANITLTNLGTQGTVVNGLNDYSYTIPTAGPVIARIEVTQPSATGMTVAIKQGSTTITTATLPGGASATQGNTVLIGKMNTAINDVIHFVLTSSSAADQQLNTVKAVVSVQTGMFA